MFGLELILFVRIFRRFPNMNLMPFYEPLLQFLWKIEILITIFHQIW